MNSLGLRPKRVAMKFHFVEMDKATVLPKKTFVISNLWNWQHSQCGYDAVACAHRLLMVVEIRQAHAPFVRSAFYRIMSVKAP